VKTELIFDRFDRNERSWTCFTRSRSRKEKDLFFLPDWNQIGELHWWKNAEDRSLC